MCISIYSIYTSESGIYVLAGHRRFKASGPPGLDLSVMPFIEVSGSCDFRACFRVLRVDGEKPRSNSQKHEAYPDNLGLFYIATSPCPSKTINS